MADKNIHFEKSAFILIRSDSSLPDVKLIMDGTITSNLGGFTRREIH